MIICAWSDGQLFTLAVCDVYTQTCLHVITIATITITCYKMATNSDYSWPFCAPSLASCLQNIYNIQRLQLTENIPS